MYSLLFSSILTKPGPEIFCVSVLSASGTREDVTGLVSYDMQRYVVCVVSLILDTSIPLRSCLSLFSLPSYVSSFPPSPLSFFTPSPYFRFFQFLSSLHLSVFPSVCLSVRQ